MKKPILVIWGVAIIAVAIVQFFALATPINGAEGAGIPRFFGRFHPLILHFPVAFLILAGVLELSRYHRLTAQFTKFTGAMLILAAASACVTVALGLLLAANEGHAGALVERHRGRGIMVALFACAAAAAYYSNALREKRYFAIGYRASLAGAIGMMGLAAHDGGSLVHGPTYLADHAPGFLKPILTTHAGERQRSIAATAAESGSPISVELRDRFQGEVGSFFGAYCSRCHGDGKQEANVNLATFDPAFNAHMSDHHWNRVLGVLGSHRMPPIDAKQPSNQARAKAISWIQDALTEYAYARRAERANAPLRRLNKREINRVYQDLFKVQSNFVAALPADPKSEHGYDTDANLLLVSMSDLRFYQDIARGAVDRYVRVSEPKDETEYFFVEMEDVYHFGRNEGDDLSHERAPGPLSRAAFQQAIAEHASGPLEFRYRKYGPLPYGLIPTGDVRGVGEGRGFARLHEQFMLLRTTHRRGEVTVRIHAAMTPGRGADASVPRLRLEAGWRKVQSLRVSTIGEYDITASKTDPQIVEFKFRLEDVIIPQKGRRAPESENNWLLLVLSNSARHENGALAGSIYGQVDPNLPSYASEDLPFIEQAEAAAQYQEVGYKTWEEGGVPYLHLDALEAKIVPVASDPSAPWIIAPPANDTPPATADRVREVLERFLPEVFRRPVREEEIQRYLFLFKQLRRSGDSFEIALREVMAAALISPEFLFIGFPEAHSTEDQRIAAELRQNQYLASRLSFFLWSSMPDARLRTLANNRKLTDAAILSAEVDRMLADPKARRLSRAFADQWLQLDKLFNVGVSTTLFPDFGPELARLMAEESRATVADVFHNDRDVRTLFSSEFMILNQELARHYEVDGVWGGDLRRVEVGNVPERAGLMTQASIMTMNSDGRDSHPIKRGVWLLERILDDPPPPPPPSVPDLDTNNPLLADLSLKEKIEHHRSLSACSGCHEKIDPWGVVLENFDAIGRWRDTVKVNETARPRLIDASTTLPDGTEVAGFAEIADYIREEKETDLMGSIVHHMMMYALGRELDILDEQEAKSVESAFRASGYKFSSLIKAIVQTDAFTNRNQNNAELTQGTQAYD